MKSKLVVLMLFAGVSAFAETRFSLSIGGYAPGYYAPPPVYYAPPPPVYYAPPRAYYAPPPVYYAPPPAYYAPGVSIGLGFNLR